MSDMFEKRIEDIKWTIGAVISVMALFAAAQFFSLSAERGALKEFKDELRSEIKERIGDSSSRPELMLKTGTRSKLSGSSIDARIWRDEKGVDMLSFSYVISNQGKARSGSMFMKVYSSDFEFSESEVDGTGYKYETSIDSDKFSPKELLGGVSVPYTTTLVLKRGIVELKGKKNILVRLYYGNGQVAEAQITVQTKN